jgi:RNA polymerase sigma-70 factor (ECF subfamily)
MRYPVENQLISIQTDALAGQSDADLVRQARTTDGQAALAALYRRYLTPVYRYFYARTGDVQQAEDLTAQTFVAALEGLSRYRERGTFAGWLFTIAARRLADQLRRRPAVPLDAAADLPGSDPPPEVLVERAERMACLARTVRTLSPDRAQAVALHFFGELSLGETARVMGRSKVAVKSLIHRALRDLRERLDDERE